MAKFELKSNYIDFCKKLDTFSNDLSGAIDTKISELLEQMCSDMKDEIIANRSIWLEDFGGLDTIDSITPLGEDVTYVVEKNTGTVSVGANTPKILMNDGRLVNPYMFIQFGWGVEGEKHPMQYAAQRKWAYNVKEHSSKGWVFKGNDDDVHWTLGRKGTDFFYSVLRKYRERWKQILRNAPKEAWKEVFYG